MRSSSSDFRQRTLTGGDETCLEASSTSSAGKKGCKSRYRNARLHEIVADLKQCTKARDLAGGKRLHRDAVAARCESDKFVAAALIRMYSKCKNMKLAQEVFDGTMRRDVVLWNSLILGYVENDDGLRALELFAGMNFAPSRVTFLAVIKACAGLAGDQGLEIGMEIHERVRDLGYESDVVVANTLVDMYSKCRNMALAQDVFDRMICKDVVSWTSLILGYVNVGESSLALEIFVTMEAEPDSFTYVAALKACASLASEKRSDKRVCLQRGMIVHKQVKERGFESDVVVANILVDMYSKCGNMKLARDVFDGMISKDVVTWTCLILGYVENGESLRALEMFKTMDCERTHITFVAALKACSCLCDDCEGMIVHKQIKERGFEGDIVVASTLVDMYSKCKNMKLAQEVFDKMTSKNVVTWNCLILGYAENGESSKALDLYASMDCESNIVSYLVVLKACSNLAMLPAGKWIHARVCKLGLVDQDQALATSLLDFYGKCGSMANAEDLFNNLHSPDIEAWTAIIAGYSLLGDSSQVLGFAKQIQERSLQMNNVTFICILTACSHAGMVEEAIMYFKSMEKHGVSPTLEHYTCLIDILGRANRLEEASIVVKDMPFEADSVTWTTLLSACRKWQNLKVGKVAFDALLVVGDEKEIAVAYTLISDIYRSFSCI